MKFDSNLQLAVKANLDSNLVVMLLGEPGIGKSSWVESLAAQSHTKCFTLACNQLADKTDLTGARLVPVTDKDGQVVTYKQKFYPHETVMEAISYAENNPREFPILFLDEINRTPSDVTSALLSIPTMRQLGQFKLPNNLRIMVAGNDKGAVTALDTASISRFVVYPVSPDVSTFLAVNPDLHEIVKKTLTEHPELIFTKSTSEVDEDNIDEILDDMDKMEQFTTPRTITAISRWLNAMSSDDLLNLSQVMDGDVSMLEQIIYAHVGQTPFGIHLAANLMSSLSNQSFTSVSTGPAKPSCFDEFKSYIEFNELLEYAQNMTASERSGCLVYALCEPEDNHGVIIALTQVIDHEASISGQTPALETQDVRTLMRMIESDGVDRINIDVFRNIDSALSKSMSVILNV